MADRERKKYKQSNTMPTAHLRKSALPQIVTTVAILAVVIFCTAIFFRVSEFTVSGNERYTAEEIVEISGIAEGSNLLLINKSEAAARITVGLPYIMEVRIGLKLPDSVTLEVTECEACAIISDTYGRSWLVSSAGRVLEEAAEADTAQYPMLSGFEATTAEPGSAFVTESEDVFEAAAAVLKVLEGREVAAEIHTIDLSRTYAIVAYMENYDVMLGGTDELEYKFDYLETEVLPYLQENRPDIGGQIDLTFENEKVARFLPW